ncbi:Aldehyde ferredoxin oxidoreductase N-terminal protein [Dioscorea alata]|uniref:Aldehyde ferredoxin oxidoreductase N-terminal protein n=1 Tax=Dioscorea alata TaxID=55571 RepID=A0ACB7UZ03_DIOAL|nr:Aldehyde ferredoxin oxidoreductase N-terminal protein [Dioscorea alata]
MVAISLYRGNLHRVPSGVRRWPFPLRSLTLNSFKILTRKRALALSRLSLQIKTKDEEKEELAPREDGEELDREGVGENGCHHRHLVPENDSFSPIEIKKEVASTEEPVQEPREVVDVGSLKTEAVVAGGDAVVEGKADETQKVNIVEDKEDKKKELQEKLHVFNEKKHLLVQMLKQTPHSRGNITTAIHGQASSNMIGNTAASPSRIISTGHQGHAAAGLPPVSVPGSQFVASSPSPATSGGASSVFRDSRLTSPSWNC